jgi:hypothetical protein
MWSDVPEEFKSTIVVLRSTLEPKGKSEGAQCSETKKDGSLDSRGKSHLHAEVFPYSHLGILLKSIDFHSV